MRFYDKVLYKYSSWDFGHRAGIAVEIRDESGAAVLRNAVTVQPFEVLEPAEYAPPERIYVASLEELPTIDLETYDEDSAEEAVTTLPRVQREALTGRYFYEKPGVLLKPAKTRQRLDSDLRLEGALALQPWLEAVNQAGVLLEHGFWPVGLVVDSEKDVARLKQWLSRKVEADHYGGAP
jgi:hypothetical protein